MTLPIPWAWWILSACSPDSGQAPTDRVETDSDADADADSDADADADADSDADTDTGTDTGSTAVTVSASCAPTAVSLVFDCAVALSAPGAATLTFTPVGGGDVRTFHARDPVADHRLYAWGLLPDTTYDWDAGSGIRGEVTTGSLPADLDRLDVTVQGTPFSMDAVFVHAKCGDGYFLMLDGQGRVIWYQADTLWKDLSDGMRWLPDEHAILRLQDAAFADDPSEVLKTDLAGDELLHLRDADLDLNTTHDLDGWHGYTYVLGHTGEWGVGGFEVFDGPVRIGEWLLSDDFPDQPDLLAIHANSLSVSETGEVVVSLWNKDTILGVDGDPASPTFLQTRWHALGNLAEDDPLPNPDYVPAQGQGQLFVGQHDATRIGDELWVFDNRSQLLSSRALRMSMDPVHGTLSELDAWPLDTLCPFQGGALKVDGGVLVTCATSDGINEFRDGADDPEFRMHLTGCGFPGSSMTRAYPVVVE